MTRAQLADAVTHVDAVGAARAPHRPAVDREYDGVAFPQRRHRARVCMRGRCSVNTNSPPAKSFARLAKQCRDLQWEHMFAIEILVQAIVIIRAILRAGAGSDGFCPARWQRSMKAAWSGGKRTAIAILSCQSLAIGASRA